MDEAERLCDRLIIIDAGRIIAAGTPRELIAAHAPVSPAALRPANLEDVFLKLTGHELTFMMRETSPRIMKVSPFQTPAPLRPPLGGFLVGSLRSNITGRIFGVFHVNFHDA